MQLARCLSGVGAAGQRKGRDWHQKRQMLYSSFFIMLITDSCQKQRTLENPFLRIAHSKKEASWWEGHYMLSTFEKTNKQTKTRHQTGLAFLSKGDKHVPGEPCKFPCLSNSPELPSWEQVSSPCPPDSWLSSSWCKPPQLSPPSPLQLLPNAWSTPVPQVLSQLVPTHADDAFVPQGLWLQSY